MSFGWILPAVLAPHMGDTIVKLLAIVGGAACGGLLIGALAQAVVKRAAGRPMPRLAHNLIRLIGAVAAGLAVCFIFGPGFGGLGLGLGGGGTGTDGHVGTTQSGPNGTNPQKSPTTSTAPQPENANPLAIEMIGGKRYKGDNRFYLVPGEKEPLTFEEVRKLIEQRRQARPPLQAIAIIIREDDSVSELDPAVRKVRQLADDLGLNVTTGGPR